MVAAEAAFTRMYVGDNRPVRGTEIGSIYAEQWKSATCGRFILLFIHIGQLSFWSLM